MSTNRAVHVDTHAHVFSTSLPITRGARYTPTHDALASIYLEQLHNNGFQRGVLVQPSFLGTNNDYLLDILQQHPDQLRGVIVIDPEDKHDLDAHHAQGVRGIRLNLLGTTAPDLTTHHWKTIGRRMADLGWHLEVQATAQHWPDLQGQLARWPADVVIDHMGLLDPGYPDAVRVATTLFALEHVWVKASAPYRNSHAHWALRHIIECAGPQRLIFGSDWPFTLHEYETTMPEAIAWVRHEVGVAIFDETLPANAERLLRWP